MNNRMRRVVALLAAVTITSSIIVGVTLTRRNSDRHLPRVEFGELGSPVGKITYTLQCTLPEVEPTIQVYRVKPLVSKRDLLLQLIKALPIKEGPETDEQVHRLERAPSSLGKNEQSLSASIGGWTIKVWDGGQFSLSNDELSQQQSEFDTESVAPTEEKARQVADTFLAKIESLPAEVHFDKVGPGRTLIRGAGDKPGDILLKSVNVYYTAMIGEIPVRGPVGIQVGAGPSVVSMTNRIRYFTPEKMVAILSPQEAFDKLRAGEGHIGRGPEWSATCHIKSVKLVYWQEILGQNLSFIMPVYIFEGDAVAEGMKTVPCEAYIEAVRPELLTNEQRIVD